MNSMKLFSALMILLLLFSGCEDKGYGTQDIDYVPSVTSSDKVTLISTIPDDQGDLAQRAYFNLSFSSYIDATTVSQNSITLREGDTKVETEYIVVRNFVFVKPTRSLDLNQSYTLTVTGLKDIFGNEQEESYHLDYRCVSDFWERVAAGVSNSMAKSRAGDLYIWGSNTPLSMDILTEETTFINIDMPLPLPNSKGAISFDVAAQTIAIVTQTGELVELGNNNYSDHSDANYRSVALGSSHSVVLKEDGTIFSWGSNDRGQLGASLILNESTTPIQEYTQDSNWSSVKAGSEFTVALKKDGSLWGWGDNSSAQIGRNFEFIPLPREFNSSTTTVSSWSDISAGGQHTLALDDNGTLWAWGDNTYGQLGDSSNLLSRTGTKVQSPVVFTVMSAGDDHSMAIDDNNSLWSWGHNGSGQLGTGDTISLNTPTQEINSTRRWSQVSAGKDYTLGITTDGRLWAWGTNTFLRLGLDENITATAVPMEVK